ncbi:CLUMA_CG014193, isoform A [Clunio marinus]|uniref:isopentenyl-diphosphate Delta-isomerase n=1 Tax=Clunio marinus TaxID=568069 RepID=A0A1J1IR23_9DIPT|nr:CLUMA_CG014193, isoform A [Clunio marinus]
MSIFRNKELLKPVKSLFSKSRYSFAHKLAESVENEKQELFLDRENCILVDGNDKNVGFASKRDCHKVSGNDIKLHRAFSVFLFNEKGEMLLQKRSNHKITFPNCYTNACCSHPLHDIENERDELNAIGIKRAAQRRLNFELGIPNNQVRPENFHYLTRIHYIDKGDGIWGEHEIDYILFLQKQVDVKPNPGEVSEVLWIKHENLEREIASLSSPLTPWFNLILKSGRLNVWWKNLERLKKFEDYETIHKLN